MPFWNFLAKNPKDKVFFDEVIFKDNNLDGD